LPTHKITIDYIGDFASVATEGATTPVYTGQAYYNVEDGEVDIASFITGLGTIGTYDSENYVISEYNIVLTENTVDLKITKFLLDRDVSIKVFWKNLNAMGGGFGLMTGMRFQISANGGEYTGVSPHGSAGEAYFDEYNSNLNVTGKINLKSEYATTFVSYAGYILKGYALVNNGLIITEFKYNAACGGYTLNLIAQWVLSGDPEPEPESEPELPVTAVSLDLQPAITSGGKHDGIFISLPRGLPSGTVTHIFACNNGHDANPTWEDVTEEVLNHVPHVFSNTTKTAATWAVNYKIVIDRGENATALSEGSFFTSFVEQFDDSCIISSIGGYF
jgi:hypothetical protein